MPPVLSPANFDIGKVAFGVPKSQKENGGKFIPVTYDGDAFVVQTPRLATPYGVSRWENNNAGGGVKLSIDMSFGAVKDNPELAPFFNMMTELNALFLNEAFNNSTSWFKKKYNSIDVIEALYTNLIKYSKDKNTNEPSKVYPPTFKVQLPMHYDGKSGYNFKTYSDEKQIIDFDTVDMKGGEAVAIVKCAGVWIAGGKFGCSWKAVQLMVHPNVSKMAPFAFVEE